MKKITLVFVLSFFVSMVNAQYKTYNRNIFVEFIDMENVEGKLECEIDSVLFSFEPDRENLWEVKIRNNRNSKIVIDWGGTIMAKDGKSSGIIFSDDSQITMNNPKAPDTVLPDTYVEKEVDMKSNFEDVTLSLYYPRQVRKGKNAKITLSIPIDNGISKKDYLFKFNVYSSK